jgi:hypothetical protein
MRYRGRRTEAQELLAPVCGWFRQGLDTADLTEAKALLDNLNAVPKGSSNWRAVSI